MDSRRKAWVTEMKVEQESDIRIKDRRKKEVFEMHFFVKRQRRVSFVSMRDRQSDGERCVEESCHEW